jgi:hypothetical protein
MTKRIASRHLHPLLFTPALPGDGLIEAEIAAFDGFWHCPFVPPYTQAIGVGAPPIPGFREGLPDCATRWKNSAFCSVDKWCRAKLV